MTTSGEAELYIGLLLDNRFEVQELRGAGTFSYVFAGLDHVTGEQVAIKILKFATPSSATSEFENEARLLELLRKASGVVNLVAAGQGVVAVARVPGGTVTQLPVRYIAMELADAALDELVLHRDRLSFGSRLQLLRHVVLGLHQMHTAKVFHRDVKAENSLVFNGRGTVVKLSDLGRSKQLAEPRRFAAEEYVVGRGDWRYAPPEVLLGQLRYEEPDMRRVDL